MYYYFEQIAIVSKTKKKGIKSQIQYYGTSTQKDNNSKSVFNSKTLSLARFPSFIFSPIPNDTNTIHSPIIRSNFHISLETSYEHV